MAPYVSGLFSPFDTSDSGGGAAAEGEEEEVPCPTYINMKHFLFCLHGRTLLKEAFPSSFSLTRST